MQLAARLLLQLEPGRLAGRRPLHAFVRVGGDGQFLADIGQHGHFFVGSFLVCGQGPEGSDGLARGIRDLEVLQEQQGGNVGREPAKQLVRSVRDLLVRRIGQTPQPRLEEVGIEPGPLDAHGAILEGDGFDGDLGGGSQPALEVGGGLLQQVRHFLLAYVDGTPGLVDHVAREKDGGGERAAGEVGLDGEVGLAFFLHAGPGGQRTLGQDLLAEFQVLFHFLAQASGGPERLILGLGLAELGQFDFPLALREGFRQLEIGDLLLEDEVLVPELGIAVVLLRGDGQAVLVLDEQERLRLAEGFHLVRAHHVFRDFCSGQDAPIDIPQQFSCVRRREQALDRPVHVPGEVRPLVEGGDRLGGIVPEEEVQALRREDVLKVQRKTEELAAVFGVIDLLDFGIDG